MSTNLNQSHNSIISGISAGLVIGFVVVIISISLGALIFASEPSYIANGIGLVMLSSIFPIVILGLFSSYKGNINIAQDAPAAILAVMAAGVVQSLSAAPPREKFISIVAIVVITTLLTGILFILLGQYKLGSLVRFLPYPVVGGFLAGSGWLLVAGGIGILANISFSFANIGTLFQSALLIRWIPSVILAFLMLIVINRYSHFLLLPGFFIGIAILFYVVVYFIGIPISELSAQGWLLGPIPDGNLLQPMSLADLNLIHWDVILSQAGSIAAVMITSLVSLLLNASGIELIIRKDMDLNRELRVVGFGNLLGGLMGGSVSYHAISLTNINQQISKGSNIASFVTAATLVLALVFGPVAFSYIPKIVLGTLLIFLGLTFLYQWGVRAWSNFSKLEYGMVLLILITIASFGYIQGVVLGLVAAVVLFAVNYSRVNITKNSFSGAELQSRMTRSPRQRSVLIHQGAQTYILKLHGFIFFGTANKLLDQVRQRIEQTNLPIIRFLILDFTEVSGLDSTALLSFSKLQQFLQDRQITSLVTRASNEVLKQLTAGGFISEESTTAKAHPNLDHGIEWVENQLLQGSSSQHQPILTLKEIFNELLPNESRIDRLFKFLKKIEIQAGERLIQQGEAAGNMYFIESGQLTSQLEYPNQPPVRLQTMRAGQVIGEIGFYLNQNRIAAVHADSLSIVYTISAEGLKRMESDDPEAASIFHKLNVLLISQRLTETTRTVGVLERL